MYGNEQSQYTMNRAAYGDVAASMMAGGNTIYGGAAHGMNNMLSDIGGMVMPVGYTPPARVNVGFYGQYRQSTGFFSGAGAVMGLGSPGRSQFASDYMHNSASDFGDRVGGGMAGLGITVGGMAVGSLMGRFLGGGIVGSLAGGIAGSAIAGVVMDAVGQRREINSFLEQSSSRFISPGAVGSDARRGGLNMQGRQQVTDMVRNMDFKDPAMSTEDLTMIMQQGAQKGMFAGSGDMEGFKKKFKELTEAVKVVTKTLGQTLDEAMTTIKELKSIGVDPAQAGGMVSSAHTLGKMAGRTGAEMLNVGLQGAELFRGTGVSMSIGAQASMMNLATIRASRDAGTLSSEAVAQAGGEEALALRQNASGMAFGQSQLGRGFGAAFFGMGMPGGGFNQGAFMGQMMGGGMGLTGLAMQAAGNLSNPAALISYQANQEKFMSEAGKTFGGRGLQIMQSNVAMSQASYLSEATGAKFEDSYRLSLKQMGMSHSEIEANIGEARGAADIYKKANAAAGATYQDAATEEAYKRNSLYMLGSKIRDDAKQVIDSVARPIEGMIDSVKGGIINFTENQVGGVRRYDLSSTGISRVAGNGQTLRTGAKNIDKGGFLGGVTAGESLYESLKNSSMAGEMREVSGESDLRDGEVIIKSNTFGKDIAVKLSDIEKKADKWNFNAADVKKAQEEGKLVKGGTLQDMLSKGIAGNNIDSLAQAAFGKKASDLTREEAMRISDSVKGTVYESSIKKEQDAQSAISNAKRAVSAEGIITAKETYDLAAKDIRGHLGSKGDQISNDSLLLIAEAASAKTPEEKQKLMKEAQLSMVKGDNLTQTEATSMIQKGMKAGISNETLVKANNSLLQLQQDAGSTALGRSLVNTVKEKGTSNDIREVQNIAGALAGADVKTFMAIADQNADVLSKKGGSAGMKIANTAKILEKIESGKIDSAEELDEAALGLGIKVDTDLRDKISDPKQKKEVMEKILGLVKSSEATTSGVSTGAGVGPEGGANAAAAFDQQMNINREILAAMSQIAQRLGAK